MELNDVTLSVRSKEMRSKGGFHIDPSGCMMPRTRHSTIWGKIDYDLIPEEFKLMTNVSIPTSNYTLNEFGIPNSVSGFFKFSRSNYNVFAESLGMRMASLFKTKTCYNCPARLNQNEDSISHALKQTVDENNNLGTMVVSILGLNDYLYTLANISQVEQPISNLETNLNTIKSFVFDKHKDKPLREKVAEITSLRQEYVYQYLFRDCFGDVDFTSRNSGIIHNPESNKIELAPQFDFGELLNVLLVSKLTPPKLDSIENYDESLRPYVKQEAIDAANASKLQRYNSTPTQLGTINTFGEESLTNITFLAQKYPSVAIDFLKDLIEFNEAGYMDILVLECSNDFTLATKEQVAMTQEFLQSRMDTYTYQLYTSLQTYAPNELQDSEIIIKKNEQDGTEQITLNQNNLISANQNTNNNVDVAQQASLPPEQ